MIYNFLKKIENRTRKIFLKHTNIIKTKLPMELPTFLIKKIKINSPKNLVDLMQQNVYNNQSVNNVNKIITAFILVLLKLISVKLVVVIM